MKTWDERASTYLTWKEGMSPQLIKRNLIYNPILHHVLRKKIQEMQPKTLLEVGCGPGRLFDLYTDIDAICIDSSELMLKRAMALCNHFHYCNIRLMKMDACDLQFETFFDVALTSNLLLHIPHDKIDAVIHGLWKYARQVVCIEWVEPGAEETGNCYLHDYISLFKNHGFNAVDMKKMPLEKQIMFHFARIEK